MYYSIVPFCDFLDRWLEDSVAGQVLVPTFGCREKERESSQAARRGDGSKKDEEDEKGGAGRACDSTEMLK